MLARQGKKAADDSRILGVYEQQMLEIDSWLAAHRCIRFLDVEYHEVLNRPMEKASEVTAFLETDLDVKAMAAAVSPELCHYRESEQR
jgi:hypothetical protein